MIRTRHPIQFKAVDLFRAFNLETFSPPKCLLPTLGDIDHPGIYTMLYKGIPMYVGKSSGSLFARMRLHFTMKTSLMNHITDEIWCNKAYITCWISQVPQDDTYDMEIQYIQRLKPFLNKRNNPDPRPLPDEFIIPGENRKTGLLLTTNDTHLRTHY